MVNFYVVKIQNGEINPNTSKTWGVEDVPKLWKEKVEKEIKK